MTSDSSKAGLLSRRSREVLSSDGTRLFVEEYGLGDDAPLLVFSHGWACQGRFWRPQIEHFATTHRVVVYDQRGHGWSDRGRAPFSSSVLGDDLEAVLRAVVTSNRKALVTGHSMGGMSIMGWAAEHPESVPVLSRGAVLASTGPSQLVSKSTLIGSPRRFRASLERAFAAGLATAGPEMLDTRFNRRLVKYGTMGPHAPADVVAECSDIVLRCPPAVRGMWGRVLATIDVSKGIDSLTVPTTVIVGSADKLTPAVHSIDLADRLQQRRRLHEFVALPQIGHMINMEAPTYFNEAAARLDAATVGDGF
ncbi:alpha/beta hydrolase [Rhodococcus sp. 15-725-2-2b]|uniref:alpha/beta fold hydrolase n=1 Tax=Nocardiaceae TaxID=85025 RepID=UPI00050C7673|nr:MULTISPECIES: alpha/beta hydrolase [Rhodococcus]OZC60576.1 alpha/beta hydrolase [Rhodococcus sp. 06-469-3-2]OZC73746.1 alpha/beta hydrolase [Rhodococcus sp. 06-418-5]OZD40899.1 alpha/beta hydrolase [Rhodococcus sp. 06-1477-1A]OZD83103.1 alpha/beta hydrolase [Rhodococcus sp. 05-2256-B4]OZD91493.1 alpha/beta hydrolase [Rhodococcus sp. 05-2256-B3]